jgi:hypothetical protein
VTASLYKKGNPSSGNHSHREHHANHAVVAIDVPKMPCLLEHGVDCYAFKVIIQLRCNPLDARTTCAPDVARDAL